MAGQQEVGERSKPSSYLDRGSSQDGVLALSLTLTHTDHLQLLSAVHLEKQLLFDRKWAGLMATRAAVS